ncbi:MAG: MFS transporter [Actinobacteria bacterium]|nr:MAG: MFS transporter [Actinomycetota bacterium]
MEQVTGERVAPPTSNRRVAIATLMGTSLELYDFYIYGTAAALVFGPLFFPEFSPLAGTLAAFATFGVAFIARPLGAVIFGQLGDRIGRKALLILSLLVMGISTFLVGLLPGYAVIGVAAPIILVVLRFLQGIGLGGEWGGAVVMASEYAPPEKRGFYAAFPQLGPMIGLLLSGGVFLLVAGLPDEQFASWGWRVPFWISILLVAVGLFVRARIAETPVFQRVVETHSEARVPVVELFRTHPKILLLASVGCSIQFVYFYLVAAFAPAYGTTQLGLSRTTMLYCVMVSAVFIGLGAMLFATISDRWLGRRTLVVLGTAYLGLLAFPFFWLMDTASPVLVAVALSLGMFGIGICYGPLAAFFSEIFSTRVRYSGTGLAFALGGVLGGAFTPIVAQALFASTGATWPVSLYILVMAIVSLVCNMLLPKGRRDLAFDEVEGRGVGREPAGHRA